MYSKVYADEFEVKNASELEPHVQAIKKERAEVWITQRKPGGSTERHYEVLAGWCAEEVAKTIQAHAWHDLFYADHLTLLEDGLFENDEGDPAPAPGWTEPGFYYFEDGEWELMFLLQEYDSIAETWKWEWLDVWYGVGVFYLEQDEDENEGDDE